MSARPGEGEHEDTSQPEKRLERTRWGSRGERETPAVCAEFQRPTWKSGNKGGSPRRMQMGGTLHAYRDDGLLARMGSEYPREANERERTHRHCVIFDFSASRLRDVSPRRTAGFSLEKASWPSRLAGRFSTCHAATPQSALATAKTLALSLTERQSVKFRQADRTAFPAIMRD